MKCARPWSVLVITLGVSTTAAAQEPPNVTLAGQYRINAYSVDADADGDARQTALRLRVRQSLDLAFPSNLRLHLQVQLGHTTDNITTTGSGTRATTLNVRHAVIDYTFANRVNLQAGIVPLTDNFHDFLFSSDWDYNPLAVSLRFPAGAGAVRIFGGILQQGEETKRADNLVHYQVDFVRPVGKNGNSVNVGATLLTAGSDGRTQVVGPLATTSGRHLNVGARGKLLLGGSWFADAAALASGTEKTLLGTQDDGRGLALRLEATGGLGRGELAMLGTWAQGEADGSGFLSPLAFVPAVGRGANSYWGYTGILTVQGPTDTGFDGDAVNPFNNGYGLASIQGRYTLAIAKALTVRAAAGYFGGTSAARRDRNVGSEVMAMGTYRFTPVLALDFGAAYARLHDGLSGYTHGAAGAFNQSASGVVRGKLALFSRLQAEF